MTDEFQTFFAGKDVVDQVLNEFQDSWRRNEPPSLTDFLKRIQDQPEDVRKTLRIQLIQLDQAVRWQLWRRQTDALTHSLEESSNSTERPVPHRAPLLEDYARNCPEIGPIDTLPLELVVHEYQLRVECCDHPKVKEYQERFPQFAAELPTAIKTSLMESDTAVTGPDGMTLSEPISVKRAGTKAAKGGTTVPMLPSERRRRNRPGELPVPAGKQFGQYELLYEIARGAMGVVYKARDVKIDRPVALKMILAGQLASSKEIRLFQREAQNAGRLVHENIVPIYCADEIGGQHFIAMAFIEGQSLAEMVRENSLAPKRAAEIVELVARALHYAHTQPQPVYHRDIKPANILMDTSGKPFVTDFGIAKRVEGEDSKATRVGIVLGTPSYMPSEQAQGQTAEIGPWSDVYSAGAVLYHLLTGKPPFLADTVMETLRQVLQEDVVSPRQLNHQVNADLEAVCLKCLEKDRHKRYQSAQEFADDLHRFLNHEPTKARPLSSLGRLARWCSRNTAVAALTITTALLLIAFSVAVSVAYVGARKDKEEALDARSDALREKGKADKARLEADESAKTAREAEASAKAEANKARIAEAKANSEAEKARKAEGEAKDSLEAQRMALVAEQKAKEKADLAADKAIKAESKAKDAQDIAESERNLAQKNLQHAIDTVEQLLTYTADEGLKDLPGGEGIRKGLAQEALRRLEPILGANPKDRQARLAFAKVKHVQARLLDITASNDVDSVFKEAIDGFEKLLKEDPKQTDVVAELAATFRDYGDSLTERSQRDPARASHLLELALTQYAKAIDLLAIFDNPNSRLEFELARIYKSRSISRFYLNDSDRAVRDMKQASEKFDGLVKQPLDQDTKRKVQRLLASSLQNIVIEESHDADSPSQIQLKTWIGQLEIALKIQEELFNQNRSSVELGFDVALTQFSKAKLLEKTESLAEAQAELGKAQKTFSNLAVRFEEISKYELLRIQGLQLSALMQAKKANYLVAAQELEEAEKAIQEYNRNPIKEREDVRFEIADLAWRVGADLLEKKNDRPNAERLITRALSAIRELKTAKKESVARQAAIIEPTVVALAAKVKASSSGSK